MGGGGGRRVDGGATDWRDCMWEKAWQRERTKPQTDADQERTDCSCHMGATSALRIDRDSNERQPPPGPASGTATAACQVRPTAGPSESPYVTTIAEVSAAMPLNGAAWRRCKIESAYAQALSCYGRSQRYGVVRLETCGGGVITPGSRRASAP